MGTGYGHQRRKRGERPPQTGVALLYFSLREGSFGDLGAVNMHTCAKVCHVNSMLGA